jgi:hypothetical protein
MRDVLYSPAIDEYAIVVVEELELAVVPDEDLVAGIHRTEEPGLGGETLLGTEPLCHTLDAAIMLCALL